MAIVKHIKSRNANYSAAINYLLFEHDEKNGRKIVDESGRSILRKEFYMDGLNCDPMSFDKECELTNAHFHKNKKREDIKSHHYIISYDLADVTENGLTGERAQAISLELAKQMYVICIPLIWKQHRHNPKSIVESSYDASPYSIIIREAEYPLKYASKRTK